MVLLLLNKIRVSRLLRLRNSPQKVWQYLTIIILFSMKVYLILPRYLSNNIVVLMSSTYGMPLKLLPKSYVPL